MDYQIKTASDIQQNQVRPTMATNAQLENTFNKTYDDCNPQVGLFCLSGKIIPICIYLVFKLFTSMQLSLFLIIVLLAAIDFWATKNIFGRKLVGIRWYTQLDDDQTQTWYFASSKPTRVISMINSIFFWAPQLLAIVFWIVILLINLVTLGIFWFGLAGFTSFLLVLNFGLFMQCKGQHRKKVNFIGKKFGLTIWEQEQKK